MAQGALHTYTVDVMDSDGNDVTVYDVLVTAPSAIDARDQVFTWVESQWPDDESDGDWGTYHPCDCQCDHTVGNGTPGKQVGVCDACQETWDCPAHGGVLIGEPELGNSAVGYHTRVDLRADDEVTA